MNNNLILLSDAYKYSHHKLYAPGTTKLYSYMESRGGKFNRTVFYGLQYFLKEFLEGAAFTQQDLNDAKEFLPQVFGRDDVFNKEGFQYILDTYEGKLPIKIKAVPEGVAVPTQNVLLTIENTDPKCFWLTNFLETLLLKLWYPITVATISREIKKVLVEYFDKTATKGAEAGIGFVLNDFGFRGVSSVESAAIGGSAHLISFDGSDNLAASTFIKAYYNTNTIFGKSIPATEHSTCTLLGKEGELEVFKHVLQTFPTGVVACVSDSYDIFKACSEHWGETLKHEVLKRKGVLVIRLDSGDPVKTILAVFEILFDKFGYTTNSKGYKVLPPQVRVIQGDGVNYDAIVEIYKAITAASISAENLVLGMGGALLQKLDRDTQNFAIKCSHATVNGKDVIVQKSPAAMDKNGNIVPSFKKSKGGRLKLVIDNGTYKTVQENDFPELPDQLVTVFENGNITKQWTFEEVRARALRSFN